MGLVAVIQDERVARRVLEHLGVAARAPPRRRSWRAPQAQLSLDEPDRHDDVDPIYPSGPFQTRTHTARRGICAPWPPRCNGAQEQERLSGRLGAEVDGSSGARLRSLPPTTQSIWPTLVLHLRASGNAPQPRVYAIASTQARADAIVPASLAEPDGIVRRMLALVDG